MKANFAKFINTVIHDYEGTKFEEVPGDKGGPTKFGITIYDIGLREGLNPTKNWSKLRTMVKNLTIEEALNIYKTKYWNGLKADELPSGIDCIIVDFMITSGTNSVKVTQELLDLTVDGKFGPKTLKALKEQDAKSFIIGFSERRRNYYKGLKNKKFDEGWQNRANKCEKYCLGII